MNRNFILRLFDSKRHIFLSCFLFLQSQWSGICVLHRQCLLTESVRWYFSNFCHFFVSSYESHDFQYALDKEIIIFILVAQFGPPFVLNFKESLLLSLSISLSLSPLWTDWRYDKIESRLTYPDSGAFFDAAGDQEVAISSSQSSLFIVGVFFQWIVDDEQWQFWYLDVAKIHLSSSTWPRLLPHL